MRSWRCFSVLFTVILGLLAAFPTRGQTNSPPNPSPNPNFIDLAANEQTTYLNSLLLRWQNKEQHGKKKDWALINADLLISSTREVNGRTVCSGSGQGTARPSSGESKAYDIDFYSDAVCRQLNDVQSGVVLATADSKQSFGANGAWRSGHLIFLACTSGYSKRQKGLALGTMGYGALFMHKHACIMQDGPIVHVVLERKKHGEWSVYVGTHERLGDKGKVSEYAVIKVEKFDVTQSSQKP